MGFAPSAPVQRISDDCHSKSGSFDNTRWSEAPLPSLFAHVFSSSSLLFPCYFLWITWTLKLLPGAISYWPCLSDHLLSCITVDTWGTQNLAIAVLKQLCFKIFHVAKSYLEIPFHPLATMRISHWQNTCVKRFVSSFNKRHLMIVLGLDVSAYWRFMKLGHWFLFYYSKGYIFLGWIICRDNTVSQGRQTCGKKFITSANIVHGRP